MINNDIWMFIINNVDWIWKFNDIYECLYIIRYMIILKSYSNTFFLVPLNWKILCYEERNWTHDYNPLIFMCFQRLTTKIMLMFFYAWKLSQNVSVSFIKNPKLIYSNQSISLNLSTLINHMTYMYVIFVVLDIQGVT